MPKHDLPIDPERREHPGLDVRHMLIWVAVVFLGVPAAMFIFGFYAAA